MLMKRIYKKTRKRSQKEEVAAAKVHTTIFNATTTRVNCSSSQRPHIAIVQTDWSLREEVEATIVNPKVNKGNMPNASVAYKQTDIDN